MRPCSRHAGAGVRSHLLSHLRRVPWWCDACMLYARHLRGICVASAGGLARRCDARGWRGRRRHLAAPRPARACQHGGSRRPSSGSAGHPRLKAPSCLPAATLWAPEQSYGRLGPAVQLWSLSAAPSKHAGSRRCERSRPVAIAAADALRHLACANQQNRVAAREAGAVPLLISMLQVGGGEMRRQRERRGRRRRQGPG